MKVEMRLHGLDGVLDMLKQLPPEIVSKRGGPVGVALRKGGNVIRDEARVNIRKIIAEPNIGGRDDVSTGQLEKSITVSRGRFGKIAASGKGERYLVWTGPKVLFRYGNTKLNVRKRRVGKTYAADNPLFYGKFLEYGTKRMRAHPWMRPAFKSKASQAIDVITQTLVKGVNKIVKKLGKGKAK